MKEQLRHYIRIILDEIISENPRVASQLVAEPRNKSAKPAHDEEDLEKEIEEFSGVGSIQGFALPLGMSPDMPIAGSKKRKKSSKRKKPSWT
jgi:hypothetical protein